MLINLKLGSSGNSSIFPTVSPATSSRVTKNLASFRKDIKVCLGILRGNLIQNLLLLLHLQPVKYHPEKNAPNPLRFSGDKVFQSAELNPFTGFAMVVR